MKSSKSLFLALFLSFLAAGLAHAAADDCGTDDAANACRIVAKKVAIAIYQANDWEFVNGQTPAKVSKVECKKGLLAEELVYTYAVDISHDKQLAVMAQPAFSDTTGKLERCSVIQYNLASPGHPL